MYTDKMLPNTSVVLESIHFLDGKIITWDPTYSAFRPNAVIGGVVWESTMHYSDIIYSAEP